MVKTKISDKKLIYLSGLFVLLLVYFLVFESRFEKKEKSKNDLFSYTIADVKRFEIEKNSDKLLLERSKNDWFIRKPRELPASKPDIDAYLYDVKGLQKEKSVGKNLPDPGLYGLKTPRLVLRVWVPGKKRAEQLLTLHLGDENPDKSGTYARFENDPEIFILELKGGSSIDRDLFYFRDKQIFKAPLEEINRISFIRGSARYELQRTGRNWSIASPVAYSNLDQAGVQRVLASLADISVRKFFDGDRKVALSEAGLTAPSGEIRLSGGNNKTPALVLGREIGNENQIYARLEGRELLFAVDKTLLETVETDLKKIAGKKAEDEKKREEERKAREKKIEEALKKEKSNEKK